MGRLLDRLLRASPAYEVRREPEGFVLSRKPGYGEAFNDIVREAADQAGDEFVVFPTSDGRNGYSQMFVLPTEADRRENRTS